MDSFYLINFVADRLLSAGHDISDGGLITCLLEMAFAGNRGVDVDFASGGVGGGCVPKSVACFFLLHPEACA